ncbi:glutaredoxin family protein [Oceanobacillus sp. CAU 1775]
MNNITVYTTTQCPYCVMIKNFLSEKDIPFKEVNLERNPEMVQQLIQKTGQMGVPQTEINGEWIIGFDPNSIMRALSRS